MDRRELIETIERAARDNLEVLNLSHKEIEELPPEIASLTALEVLFLEGNQLRALPPEIASLTALQELHLENNPLTFPPPEIVEQGTDAILPFVREEAAGGEQQWVPQLIMSWRTSHARSGNSDPLIPLTP
jgi:Leucine-rich repeat (LRR) protein